MREDVSSSQLSSQFVEASTGEESFMSDIDVTSIHSTPNSTGSSPSVTTMSCPVSQDRILNFFFFFREDNSWHYIFNIPWSKIPSTTVKILDAEKRPSAAERREII